MTVTATPKTLEIVKYPHPILRKKCEPVTKFDAELLETAQGMFRLMECYRGLGLAANQVGISLRLITIDHTRIRRDWEPVAIYVLVNPEIVKRGGSSKAAEGCLSLPGVVRNVARSNNIRVKAFNLKGKPITVTADGLLARVIQHEIDHLDGKLIIDIP